jgi:hypothetical protein
VRRAFVLRAALVGLAAACATGTIVAHSAGSGRGYYVGKTTCGSGSKLCPKQSSELLFYSPRPGAFKVEATIECSFARPGQRNFRETVVTTGHIGRDGRLSAVDKSPGYQVTVRGRLAHGKVAGTIDFEEEFEVFTDGDQEEELPCRARGVRFAGAALGHTLWKSARYPGRTSCRTNATSSCGPPQQYGMSMRVTQTALEDINMKLRCVSERFDVEAPPDYVSIRRIHVAKISVRWDGRFLRARPPFEIDGTVRAGLAKGQIEYTGEAPGASDDDQCHARFSFRARSRSH